MIDRAAALKAAGELERQTGVSLDWDMPVEARPFTFGKSWKSCACFYRGADVLILDEPTAVLAPSQIRDLMQLLKRCATRAARSFSFPTSWTKSWRSR